MMTEADVLEGLDFAPSCSECERVAAWTERCTDCGAVSLLCQKHCNSRGLRSLLATRLGQSCECEVCGHQEIRYWDLMDIAVINR